MMERTRVLVIACVLLLAGCSGGDTGGNNGGSNGGDSGTDDTSIDTNEADTSVDDGGDGGDVGDTSDSGSDEDATAACDFRTENGMVVFQAESLPLSEDWTVATEVDGYTGDGYIEWTGESHNNDPTHGVMEIAIRIDNPGRYRLQWYNRIGAGSSTTEHNDTWVKFPDADDYYGLKGTESDEIRRYPEPQCSDDTFMDGIRSLSEVSEATCVEGSTSDGWLKVYSSGASDWKWSTRTSDNDASEIMVEFGEAGVYTLQMAARADHHLIDRIVLHEESLDNSTVRDTSLPETPCSDG